MAWGWKLAAGPREERRSLPHEQLAPRSEVRFWVTVSWSPSSFFVGRPDGFFSSEWSFASPPKFFLGRSQRFHFWETLLSSSHGFQSISIFTSISGFQSTFMSIFGHLGPFIIWRPSQTWRAIWKAINDWSPILILIQLVQVMITV